MFNSPANGRAGELFPSPAKGHVDNPGLSEAQDTDAQALIDSSLSGYYPRGTVDNLLAGKQPTIGEGSLAQDRVAGLVSDLAAKASASELTASLTAVNANLTNAIVTSQTTLEAQIDTKASMQQLALAVATREPTIIALEMARVAGLAEALAQKADATALSVVATKAGAAETTAALATKADAAQTTAALAGKVDNATFTEANAQRITVDAQLEANIAAKAGAAETTAALAQKPAPQTRQQPWQRKPTQLRRQRP